jgi:hypothetical protein
MSQLLTFAEAAEKLKWKKPGAGRRLKRTCLSRERQSGKPFIVRLKGDNRVNYRVTIGALRTHMPELFHSAVDDLTRSFSEYLENIDDKLRDRVSEQIAETVEPRLEELWQRDEIIAENLNQLGKRVEAVAAQVNRPQTHRPPKTTEDQSCTHR